MSEKGTAGERTGKWWDVVLFLFISPVILLIVLIEMYWHLRDIRHDNCLFLTK